MFSLFRKKTVGFAGETAATILYSNGKDDTLVLCQPLRVTVLLGSGKELTNRSGGTGAPSQWTRVGGLVATSKE